MGFAVDQDKKLGPSKPERRERIQDAKTAEGLATCGPGCSWSGGNGVACDGCGSDHQRYFGNGRSRVRRVSQGFRRRCADHDPGVDAGLDSLRFVQSNAGAAIESAICWRLI